MDCILADRLYVPEEYVTPEHLNEFVYQIEENENYEFGPFQTATGSIRTFGKAKINDQIYYAFSRGNLEKLGRLFGDLPWTNKTCAKPMKEDLQFKGTLHTWETKQIGQKEAVMTWLRQKGGIIKAPPRFGKTISSIFILTKLKLKTLIIAHQIDLLEQFYKSFIDFTNIDDIQDVAPKQKRRNAKGRIVGFFTDYDNPEELDVCLLCWQTFASKYGSERIAQYGNTWGTIIVDECHPYDTPVLIDYDKYMSIGEIYENPNITHVLSYDLDKKRIEKRPILARRWHESDKTRLAIRVKDEKGLASISPTENHKYYVVGKGYVEAKYLCAGDNLMTCSGLTETNRILPTQSLLIQSLLTELYRKREPLVESRNLLIDKPFFLFRPALKRKVKQIDVLLDSIDLEIWVYRNQQYVEVVSVTKVKKPRKDKRVYNLEVADNHNYFVVASRVTEGRIKKIPTTPLLVSNCHKVGGICYAKTVNRLPARYRLGLTGTVERVDGREFLLRDIVGPVVAEGRVATIPCRVVITHTNIPIKYTFGEPLPYLYKRIYANQERMEILLNDLQKDVDAGRYICFAFHRCSVRQLREWTDKIKMLGIKAESFYGSCPDREGVLLRARSGETRVLVCNSQMLTGLDVPRWDTYYSAFPTSNIVFNDEGKLSGNFYQEFSRIRTPFISEDGKNKTEGLIRDYVDSNSMCYGSYKKRYRAYTNQQFKLEVVKLERPVPPPSLG